MQYILAIAGILATLLSLPVGVAQAQTISVDLATAKLSWDWTQGAGGAVTEFHVLCGQSPGAYTRSKVLVDPLARSVMVKDAILGAGKWFCVVTAANASGESPPTNEVGFDAGVRPAAPSNLKVQAQ